VLLNTPGPTSATLLETITNGASSGANTITFPSVATSPFSGTEVTYSVSLANQTTLHHYTFAPTSIGAYSTSATIFAGSNKATFTLEGNAVAPVASIAVSPLYARIGGGATTIAAITVSNAGNGDLYSNTSLAAQLQGSIGTPSGSVFTGTASSFTLNDSNYTGSGTATTTAAFSYVYTTATTRTPTTASVTVSLANGSSNTNAAGTSVVTLTGQGVGPAFQSKFGSTTYSNSTNVGNNTLTAGTIAFASSKPGATVTTMVTLSNVSTDPGSASLTDLTLKSFNLSGPQAADFSVLGFTTNTVLAEAQSVTVALDFSGATVGNYDADLSWSTDQGAALGGNGAVYTFLLDPWVVPEPATIVTFGMGLAGLGWVRRRRNARRSATGTNTATV